MDPEDIDFETEQKLEEKLEENSVISFIGRITVVTMMLLSIIFAVVALATRNWCTAEFEVEVVRGGNVLNMTRSYDTKFGLYQANNLFAIDLDVDKNASSIRNQAGDSLTNVEYLGFLNVVRQDYQCDSGEDDRGDADAVDSILRDYTTCDAIRAASAFTVIGLLFNCFSIGLYAGNSVSKLAFREVKNMYAFGLAMLSALSYIFAVGAGGEMCNDFEDSYEKTLDEIQTRLAHNTVNGDGDTVLTTGYNFKGFDFEYSYSWELVVACVAISLIIPLIGIPVFPMRVFTGGNAKECCPRGKPRMVAKH